MSAVAETLRARDAHRRPRRRRSRASWLGARRPVARAAAVRGAGAGRARSRSRSSRRLRRLARCRRASGGSAGGRSPSRSWRCCSRSGRRAAAPRRSATSSTRACFASTLQYATPLALRRPRRRLLRALRRGQHRPRGHDADGRVLRHLGGGVERDVDGSACSSPWSPAALLALIHAVFTIHLRADQIVIGTAINFLALGITGYVFIDVYGNQGTPPNVSHGARTSASPASAASPASPASSAT